MRRFLSCIPPPQRLQVRSFPRGTHSGLHKMYRMLIPIPIVYMLSTVQALEGNLGQEGIDRLVRQDMVRCLLTTRDPRRRRRSLFS